MLAVSAQDVFARRKRGPRGKFDSQDMRIALLLFLSDTEKTYRDAAAHFGCSVELIDKAVAKIKKESSENAPSPHETNGGAASTADAAASSMADASRDSLGHAPHDTQGDQK
jgi:hypothetical protein